MKILINIKKNMIKNMKRSSYRLFFYLINDNFMLKLLLVRWNNYYTH